MNMASISILFLFFVVIGVQSEGKTYVKVECKTGNVGQYGQQSLLDCVVKNTEEASDPKILVVVWKKKGSEVPLLVFHQGENKPQPGYKFAESSWNDRNMNVSLLITNTMMVDDGNYTCMVMTDSGDHQTETSLTVTAFIKVECKTGNVGQYGQQSLLDCVFKTTEEVKEPKILVVTWKKKRSEVPLLLFHQGETKPQPGYKFAESSWNNRNMNVSLLITNTMMVNDGDYTCLVMTDSGDYQTETSLTVTAKYNKPTIRSIPEKIARREDVTLICSSVGGYPRGQLRWFDEHNKDWTASSEMKAEKTSDGLFKLSSELSLLKNSIFSKYTCVVFNSSGGKEDEVTLEIPGDGGEKESDQTSKIVAPVVVIGSLIVGLLLALLFYRRRSQRDHVEMYKRPEDGTALSLPHSGDCSCHMDITTY